MVKKVLTIANVGLEGFLVVVEADQSRALPWIEIVWLPDASVKESRERIKATFKNLWISLPPRKIILNLAPSDIKKIGTRYDLAMAVAMYLLLSDMDEGSVPWLKDTVFLWELGLDGSLRGINGVLPAIIQAYKQWIKKFVIPEENLEEAKYIKGIQLFGAKNFSQILEWIHSWELPFVDTSSLELKPLQQEDFPIKFEDIKGHYVVKRALSIAAAGLHNVLLVGPPGSGKSMLLKALPSIMPPMSFEEMLETSQIYSLVGKLNAKMPLVSTRPFRHVHHTASKVSIIWGWAHLTPWEVSLAHNGILFFDELPEFPREVLEVLRQPLEDGFVTISRAHWSVRYPASFMFVAAMNPCKCGYYWDKQKACTCTINEVKKYQSKVSWPLLDRFDFVLEVWREDVDKLLDHTVEEETSEQIRQKVAKAWEIQQKRFENETFKRNSQMGPNAIKKYIRLEPEAEDFLKQVAKSLVLSPRVVHRILKTAQTLADLQWEATIKLPHIAEVVQYRSKEMFIGEE